MGYYERLYETISKCLLKPNQNKYELAPEQDITLYQALITRGRVDPGIYYVRSNERQLSWLIYTIGLTLFFPDNDLVVSTLFVIDTSFIRYIHVTDEERHLVLLFEGRIR
jgi:hypothetical protein